MLKKFFISITKSLIVLVILTLVFSSTSLSVTDSISGISRGLYEYSSPDAQKIAVNKLKENCGSLEEGKDAVTMKQLCSNSTLLDSMRENCKSYFSLKGAGINIKDEGNLGEACMRIESNEFEKACRELKNKVSLSPDSNSLRKLCSSYNSGIISGKEFFDGIIKNSFSGKTQIPMDLGALEKYNQAMAFLNGNKFIYFVALAILGAIMFLLISDIRMFLITLAGIFFGIGILILLPYFLILAYDGLYGIDTTSILSAMFSGNLSLEPKTLISALMVVFLQAYNHTIVSIGIIMLALGIIGKIYGFTTVRNMKNKSTK